MPALFSKNHMNLADCECSDFNLLTKTGNAL